MTLSLHAISKRSIAELAGQAIVEQTICILVLSLGIIMAGSGDHSLLGLTGRPQVPDCNLRVAHGAPHGPRSSVPRRRTVQLVDRAESRGCDGVRILSQVSYSLSRQQVCATEFQALNNLFRMLTWTSAILLLLLLLVWSTIS